MLDLTAMKSLLYYASRAPEGVIVEIGVYQGGSAWALAQLERPMFLYDTFTGIPYQGKMDGNPVGKFSDTSIEQVRALVPKAVIVQGLFPDSLIDMPPVGFVHADADQYESTKAILEHIPSKMVHGGFILFDDFGVFDCQGCTQAVYESGLPFLTIRETGKALVIV
jgi:O-methyltransferase